MELFTIIAKVSVVSSIFLIAYYLLLHSAAQFKISRYFLLCGVCFALVVPFIPVSYTVYINSSVNEPVYKVQEVDEVPQENNQDVEVAATQQVDYKMILTIIYILICAFFAIRLISSLIKGNILIKQAEKVQWESTYLYVHPKVSGPMVFGNKIMVKDKTYLEPYKKDVLLHELIHQKEHHWLDVILVELLLILSWINPLSYLYKRVLLENLEYIADRGALDTGLQLKSYIRSILCETMGAEDLVAANHFRTSQNKKRLKMMKIVKHSKYGKLKLLLVLPILGLLLWSFSKPNYVYKNDGNALSFSSLQTRSKLVKGFTYIQDTVEVLQEDGTYLQKIIVGAVSNVNIVIKGTSIGTFSNEKGHFELNVKEGDVLVFSHVKYKTEEVKYKGQKEIGIAMDQPYYQFLSSDGYKSRFYGKSELQVNLTEIYKVQNMAKDGERFIAVEEIPHYKYGMEGYFAQLYSEAAQLSKSKGLNGSVDVMFTIPKEGGISNVTILGKHDEKIKSAALQIVKSLSDWSPASQRGEKLDFRYCVTVEF